MKDTAPKGLGVIAIAALFGFIALLVAYVILNFAVFASIVIGAIVAVITAIVLWLGWRDAAEGPTGPLDLSASANAEKATNYETTAPAAQPTAAVTAAAATPASFASSGVTADTPPAVKAAPAAKAAKPAAKAAKPAAKTAKPAAKTAKPAAKATAAKAAKPAAKATAAKVAKPAAKVAPAKAAKPAATKAARAPVAADDKPETLKKARASGADDLKQIKGVGPGLEKTLNELGFYHFDQIQNWRKAEIEWVDSRLKFKGRIVRDEWTKQAKTLAKGGTTEFAKKVKKGDIY